MGAARPLCVSNSPTTVDGFADVDEYGFMEVLQGNAEQLDIVIDRGSVSSRGGPEMPPGPELDKVAPVEYPINPTPEELLKLDEFAIRYRHPGKYAMMLR